MKKNEGKSRALKARNKWKLKNKKNLTHQVRGQQNTKEREAKGLCFLLKNN